MIVIKGIAYLFFSCVMTIVTVLFYELKNETIMWLIFIIIFLFMLVLDYLEMQKKK